jgi:hypothetical protein
MGLLDASALYLYPACGLVLMLLTWPRAATGRRVLRRWGDLAAPTGEQVALMVRYLRERCVLVVPLMLLAPLTARAIPGILGSANDLGLYHLLGALLLAWLLAEALAILRPRRGAIRTAPLVRREWRGLVPRWAMALHLTLTLMAVLFAGLGHGGWYPVTVAVVAWVVVYGIGGLAVLRPVIADSDVDTASRLRSARTAVGVGILLATLLATAAANRLPVLTPVSLAMLVVALVGWSGVIAAPRRAALSNA